MKKKGAGRFLFTIMAVGLLIGCRSSQGEAPALAEGIEAEGGERAEADQEKGKEGEAGVEAAVFYYTYSDAYVGSVHTALDAALEEKGISYQNYDANNNQKTQNEQIDVAIAQGADVLVVNIVTAGLEDASMDIINKAKAADIPVIFFNRTVESDGNEGIVLGSYEKCAFVGTDAPQAGHMQGKMAGEYLLKHYETVDLNGDGIIQYALFMGQRDNVEAIARTQYGVEDANAVLTAAGKPELEYFDASNVNKFQVDENGAWSTTAAYDYMTENLLQYNEMNGNMIEAVICNNDSMAEGAIAALNEAGYNMGSGNGITIPVFGVDATDSAVGLITRGKMAGTIKQDAEGMARGIAHLIQNVSQDKELLADTEDFMLDADLSNKIYIPYSVYTGE